MTSAGKARRPMTSAIARAMRLAGVAGALICAGTVAIAQQGWEPQVSIGPAPPKDPRGLPPGRRRRKQSPRCSPCRPSRWRSRRRSCPRSARLPHPRRHPYRRRIWRPGRSRGRAPKTTAPTLPIRPPTRASPGRRRCWPTWSRRSSSASRCWRRRRPSTRNGSRAGTNSPRRRTRRCCASTRACAPMRLRCSWRPWTRKLRLPF